MVTKKATSSPGSHNSDGPKDPKVLKIRELAERDFVTFCKLMNPTRLYGQAHEEVMRWMSADGFSLDQLLLLPRGHMKSHLVAMFCLWWITKFPAVTILYVSATEDLAMQQLYAIKTAMESDIYRRYWPEMIHPEEAKREEWSAKNIKVDHPQRKEYGVRDRTVAARGVGSNTTGLHCQVLIFDDLVVPDNAYTQLGRQAVQAAYSQFSSIADAGAITKVVGTRYHNADLYSMLLGLTCEVFDDEGNVINQKVMYDVFQRVVEEGGVFLWPREYSPKTKTWYGFNRAELAKIRAKYTQMFETAQFYAQYYNNPNGGGSERIESGKFQYYDRKNLVIEDGRVYINGKVLAVFAAGDLAYTTTESSDYTAFAVVGVDVDGMIYILDLIQIKTNKYDKYFSTVHSLWEKWCFSRIRIETNAGANLVVEYLKDEFRKIGSSLVIEGKNSTTEKIERCAIVLEPRYENQVMWHYRGGYTSEYEEQVLLARPANDDLRDAVAAAVEISKPPSSRGQKGGVKRGADIITHERFGGRVRGGGQRSR